MNFFFFWWGAGRVGVGVISPIPHPHPRRAGYISLSGNMLKNCLALVALPAARLIPA